MEQGIQVMHGSSLTQNLVLNAGFELKRMQAACISLANHVVMVSAGYAWETKSPTVVQMVIFINATVFPM